MSLKPIAVVVALLFAFRLLAPASQSTLIALSLLSSAVFLETSRDFESVAGGLAKKGTKAVAPATIVGHSGVKHEFALAVLGDGGKARVVVDTELSVNEVDEMRVLKFYVKVFDVAPAQAILCVSPKLSERAEALAKEYKIVVVKDEVPRKLILKASEEVQRLLGKVN